MENLFSNVTLNSSKQELCHLGLEYVVVLSLIDIITFLVGQPVIAKLLWLAFTSKKTTDILNCNLALFHNLQYLISILHLIALFLLPHSHLQIQMFLLVYVEIGGSMSLSFICLERYAAVIHPTSYPLLKKYRCREVCAATVWLFSVPIALASIMAPNAPPNTLSFLTEFPCYVMVSMTAMMVWCSYSIVKTLKKSGPGRDELHPAKKRAFKIVCATSTITLFCYVTVSLLQRSNVGANIQVYDCIVLPVCISLLSAASVVHPLIYLSTQGKLAPCLKKARWFS